MRSKTQILATLSPLLLLAAGSCSNGGGGSTSTRPGLILAQANFVGGAPGPSRMLIARGPADPGAGADDPAGQWTLETVEPASVDEGGNVFHKALAFEPVTGEPGILTISANPAHLTIWRRSGGSWTPEVLWKAEDVGDKQNRLRDMEVGDVDGDGVQDVVIVTHDLGQVFVVRQRDGKLVPEEVDRTEERTFIHEVEIGDIDGDGALEFFATPSAPNKMDGGEQPGDIVMYRWNGSGFDKSVVEHFTTRHVKEVLATTLDGQPVLLAAIEGEGIGGGEEGASTAIKVYRWKDGGFEGEEIATLPGKLCRFLNVGDTDGDGTQEVVASTYKNGIHAVWQEDGEWKTRIVVEHYLSGSFEHATLLYDWDGDGADDVFVASDSQKRLQRFTWNAEKQRYERERLADIEGTSFFTFNMTKLPAGW